MSGSGVWGEAQRSAVVRAVLGEEKNSVKLHSVLIDRTTTFMITNVVVGDSEVEVKLELPSGPKEWQDTFKEAWEAAAGALMPAVVKSRSDTWAGMFPPTPGGGPPPPPPGAGGGAPGGAGGCLTTGSVASTTDDALLFGLDVSPHDREKALLDIKAQGLQGTRMMGLSLGLMSGRVQPQGDSAGLRYASDLRLCPNIRAQRKAGVETLDDIIKSKDKRTLSQHYTRLAKEYNDHGMIQEATLVSQFWAESMAAWESDDVGLFVYLAEWNRVYAGRGIPKLLDTDLILRNQRKYGSGSGGSDVKELKEQLSSTKSKLAAAEQKTTDILARLKALEKKPAPADKTGCFVCGGNHLARNCPNAPDEVQERGKTRKKVTIAEGDEKEE